MNALDHHHGSDSCGLFLSLEGLEGVGKSTNLEFIKRWLVDKGIEVVVTREPGGTPLAEEVRALLLANRAEQMDPLAELLLVFAARAQHLRKVIQPAMRAGRWVLCDRFTDATFAYQGFGRQLPHDQVAQLEQLVQQGLQPNLTIFLDLDVDTGLARVKGRGGSDRFERESHEFFERVRSGYRQRIKEQPERFAVIDASAPLSEVQARIAAVLDRLLGSKFR